MQVPTASLLPDERLDLVNDNISLIQNTRCFRFGTDALLLAGFIGSQHRSRAAELGSGSGIISLLCLSRDRFAQIHAVEVQPYFAELTARNAARNGFSGRINVHCADVTHVTPHLLGGEVDAVFSNPPYLTQHSGKQNTVAENRLARHESTADIADFCACAARLLRHGGSFYVVYRPDRLSDLITALRSQRLEPKKITFVHPDPASPPSLVLMHAKYGAAAGGLHITPPFTIYQQPQTAESPRCYSSQMTTLLAQGDMEEPYE